MNAYIIDTETTGLAPPIEATEIAYKKLSWSCVTSGLKSLKEGYSIFEILDIMFLPEHTKDNSVFCQRYRPNKKIEAKAAELTGITDALVKNCPPSSSFILPEMTYFIAHNAVFDWRVLNKPEVKRICTKEIAQNIFATCKKDGLKNNKLSSLIEFFYPNEAKELLLLSHGALQDIKLVYLLLMKIAEKLPKADSFEYLLKYCSQTENNYEELNKVKTISDKRFNFVGSRWYIMFGKHSGKELTNVPISYLAWLYENVQSVLEKELIKTFLK